MKKAQFRAGTHPNAPENFLFRETGCWCRQAIYFVPPNPSTNREKMPVIRVNTAKSVRQKISVPLCLCVSNPHSGYRPKIDEKTHGGRHAVAPTPSSLKLLHIRKVVSPRIMTIYGFTRNLVMNATRQPKYPRCQWKNRRWNSFSPTNDKEARLLKLNRQTACPPRAAVSVNQGCGGRLSHSTHPVRV